VLQYGPRVVVESPPALAAWVRDQAEGMLAAYR
jgi:predicted DNA-binding transcriptional regulator YafY